MADQKKRKPTATASTDTPAPKRKNTNADKPFATATKKDKKVRRKDKRATREQDTRQHTFAEQFLPYVLGALGLFLGTSFVLDFMSGVTTPSAHLMGPFGYYMCYFLFGLLGWMIYLVPLTLIGLAIFWRRFLRRRVLPIKIILAVLLLVLIAAVIHVAICAADPALAGTANPLKLYKAGAALHGGGVIGGLLGYLLYLALRLPGTILLAVVTLPLIVMGLLGVTPVYVFGKMVDAIRERRARKAEERALREEEEEEEDDEDYEDYDRRDDRYDRRDDRYDRRENRRDRYDDEDYDRRDRRRDDRLDDRRRDDRYDRDDRRDNRRDDRYDRDDRDDRRTDKLVRKGRGRGKADPAEGDARHALVDLTTGEVLDGEMAAEAATRTNSPTVTETAAEEVPAERSGVLPLFDRGGSARTTGTAPADRGDSRSTVEVVSGASAADILPWCDDAADDDAIAAENPDSMDVGFEDDLEPAAAPIKRHVSFEVVADGGEAASTKKASEPVTVRILKAETGAVDERGLSDEELVLPSGSGDFEDDDVAGEAKREYQFPSVDMLTKGSNRYEANEAEIAENTETLREVLESFHIRVKEISCSCGPTITRFEVKPDTGVRVRSIANLVDDIAMNLAKAGVRIEAPIPGKSAVGIEVPNAEPSTVYLRNILEAPEFRNHKSRIAACLGADVSGRPVILDINKMPHLLIAGATGMGKSVCINSIIMSILYKARPDEVKLILIDPKKVEFAMYRDLPHLYAPIVSDPKKAAGALNSAVNEMERRFELIEEVGVRNLAGYNEVTADDPERPAMPQMVIIIDELADLMMTAPADVETAICRLAQKARAAGIHLIIGTQRPSVDVITGLIKANIPSRVAFTVASAVDSRTIIDTVGADKLIGRGDMLYAPVGATKPMRVQGTFVSESEVERVVTFIKEHNERAEYDEEFTRNIDLEAAKCGVGKKKGEQMSIDDFDGLGGGGEDPKFWEALEVVVELDKVGTSALQRKCKIGYGKAAGIIDRMEELGFVGPDPGTKQGRKVYITKQDLMQYKLNGLPGSRSSESEDEAEGVDGEI